MNVEVTVLNRQRGRRVSPGPLRTFVERLSRELRGDRLDSVAICLVSDRRMRRYNRSFRGHDSATDVLSFPGLARRGAGMRRIGDIVISVESAARQARAGNRSFPTELRLLALHGYLHLLGYDHETDDGTMLRVQRRLERRLLRGPAGRRRS